LRPLVIVDVDEVLAMFMQGFERFLGPHGCEMRITRFALFQNIYQLSDGQVLDLDRGRELFNHFFEEAVADIEPTPGASEALSQLASRASIVILTNAPAHGREPRSRWLIRHGFDYPMSVKSGS
jgi:FMN phosphatase YigB (HAD superfamily)